MELDRKMLVAKNELAVDPLRVRVEPATQLRRCFKGLKADPDRISVDVQLEGIILESFTGEIRLRQRAAIFFDGDIEDHRHLTIREIDRAFPMALERSLLRECSLPRAGGNCGEGKHENGDESSQE